MKLVQDAAMEELPASRTAVRSDADPAAPMPVPTGITGASAHGLQRFIAKRIAPRLSRQVQYIGRTGVAGVGLLVFALAFFLGAQSSLTNHLAELQSNLDSAQGARSAHDSGAASSPSAQMHAFATRLPARSELPAITEKIVGEAAAAGIALERGSYDFSITHSGRLVRARMTFPVHGRYPDIRRFVDGTLAAVPGAAVDGLRLERKDIGAPEIDAEIRFAVYLRSAP